MKFEKLVLLLEDDDPDISYNRDDPEEPLVVWNDPDAICFGIVGDTMAFTHGGTHLKLFLAMYLDHCGRDEMVFRKNLEAVGWEYDEEYDQMKSPEKHTSDMQGVREIRVRYIGSEPEIWAVRKWSRTSYFESSGRIWTDRKICSFWALDTSNPGHLTMLDELLTEVGLDPDEAIYEIEDDRESRESIVGMFDYETPVTVSPEIRAKAHLIGGKWGQALRKL